MNIVEYYVKNHFLLSTILVTFRILRIFPEITRLQMFILFILQLLYKQIHHFLNKLHSLKYTI